MHTRLVAGMIAAFALSTAVVSAEQQWPFFEVSPKEVATAEELANQLAGLSRRVDPNEAKPGGMRLRHRGAAKAGVSAVWHANF